MILSVERWCARFVQSFHTVRIMSLLERAFGGSSTPNAAQIEATRRARLAELESVIKDRLDSFIKAGAALATIRDEQLYRLSHGTFADYVTDRWGMTARRAYQLIAGTKEAETILATQSPVVGLPTATTAERVAALPIEAQRDVRDALNGKTKKPTKSKKKRRPARLRFRVPGAIVIIERRSEDVDTITALLAAVDQLKQRSAAA